MENEFLENLVEIQSGYQTRGKIKESSTGKYYLLQARDIVGGDITWESPLTFNPEIEPDRYRIRHQDILFIARGYENKAYLAKNPPENILASNSFYIIKAQEINPGFLAWYLNQQKAQAYFAQFQVKSGFAYMSKTNLKELQVPIPPLATQTKIAELQHLKEKEKALTQQINNKKEQLINAVCLSKILNEER